MSNTWVSIVNGLKLCFCVSILCGISCLHPPKKKNPAPFKKNLCLVIEHSNADLGPLSKANSFQLGP